jgi:AAA ATPase domain
MAERTEAGVLSDLVGRERERAAIELLRKACAAEGGALVFRGEAGIGKSALLELALHPAEPMTVPHVAGVQAETDLAFAGLFGLLRPIVGSASGLPPTQAAALQGALGMAPSPDPDRFLVSAAVLGILAVARSASRWCASSTIPTGWTSLRRMPWCSLARRLRAERVAMLFAARDGERQQFEAEVTPEMWLTGIDAGEPWD